MTVNELIEALQRLPGDLTLPVVVARSFKKNTYGEREEVLRRVVEVERGLNAVYLDVTR